MFPIDKLDYLSQNQVVTKTTFSQFKKDIGYACNWGQTAEIPRWLWVNILGTHTNKLTVQLLGAQKEDLTDAKVISQSRQYEVAELKKGKAFFLAIPPTEFTYRYVVAKYIVDGTEDTTGSPTNEIGVDPCPPLEVGTHPAELANGVNAVFVCVNNTNEIVHTVNEDKKYSS